MIISTKKPFEEVLEDLEGDTNIVIIGCGECATATRTGGPPEVAEMKAKLEEHGKKVVFTEIVHTGCHELDVKRILRQNKETVDEADAFLVLSCGAGTQAVPRGHRQARRARVRPAVPGQHPALHGLHGEVLPLRRVRHRRLRVPSAPSPAAPRAWSTVPAAAPATASARWIPRWTAPGRSSSTS